MKRIVLITLDGGLKQEISALLPADLRLSTTRTDAADEVILLDLDTVRAAQIKELSENQFVIALTRQKSMDVVMQAITVGAYEVLLRPIERASLATLLQNIASLRQELKNTVSIHKWPLAATCAIVGHSPEIMDVCKKLARLSQVEAPVLITGETGTGKELIAETVAQMSSRFGKPFIVINCAAVPENLLESELFGYEKGAFTGAVASKEGMLKLADEGCVFLDEIGELPLSFQSKLLRFLQTQTFYPIGGTREINVNVRVISATNRNLDRMVKERKFREDLYHRLRVTTIHAPALRERRVDIIPLVHFFLHRYRHSVEKPIKGYTKAFIKKLLDDDWTGNIRELENTIRSAIALSKTSYLTTHDLKDFGEKTATAARGQDHSFASVIVPFLKEALEKKKKNIYERLRGEIDRVALNYVMSHAGENQSEASRLLGITRLTLRKKIRAME